MVGTRFWVALLLLSAPVGVQTDAADRAPASARHIQDPDHRRLDAERASAEAAALRQQGTAESLKASVPAFERAITEWRALPDRPQLASALRGLGLVHRTLGQTKEAIAELTEAADLMVDDVGQRAGILNDLGGAHYLGGDPHRALAVYAEALDGLRRVHDRVTEARTLNNVGTVQMNLGEMHHALAAYEESLAKANPDDQIARSSTLSNLGAIHANIGDVPKAKEYLTRALEIRRAIDDKRGQAATLYLLGNVEQGTGDPQKALEYLKESLALRRATGDRAGEAYSVQTLGSAYEKLGELGVALDYLEQARRIRHDMGSRNDEADTLTLMSAAYGRQGRRTVAIEYGERALRLMQEVGNARGEGASLVSLGELYREAGDNQRSLEYLERALPLTRRANDAFAEARAAGTAAAALVDLGRAHEALDHLQRAQALASQAGDTFAQVEWQYETGRAQARLGDLAAARVSVERAVKMAEAVRSRLVGAEFRAHYFATVRNAYDLLIDTLMRLDKAGPGQGLKEAAFEVSEHARARSLLDLLSESHADFREGADEEILGREQTVESALAAKAQYAARLQGRPQSASEVDLTRREVDSLTTTLRETEAEIRLKSPRYAALTQPSISTIDDVQRNLLDEGTLLLEYALGAERSYVWAVTRRSVEVRVLPSRAVIEAAVRRVYRQVSTNDPASAAEAVRALSALGTMLTGSIPNLAVARRLAVVADGSVEYVPFGALLGPSGAPLLLRCEVVTLPSASTLAALRGERAARTAAPKFIAAMADPVFDKEDPRVGREDSRPSRARSGQGSTAVTSEVHRSAEEAGIGRLERLRFSRQEAEFIQTLVSPSERLVALDFDASRDRMFDPALRDYRIIHIATHGLINSQHPELSGLVLSLVDRHGLTQDGFVKSYELYALKLNADLVVLSACQTALGEEIRGEGLISLTRPFMYAGVPRVVASLWQVPDRATATLMTLFYRGMVRDRLSPAIALRRAQLTLRKTPRWSRPYFWAGFTLQGDWR